MGKATRIKRETAREKIAAQRAAARKAQIRNRMFITGGSILGVVVIVAAFLIFKATQNPAGSGSSGSASGTGTALPASVIKDITTVPAATLSAVGAGSTTPKSTTGITGTALTSAGKPEVLYIGAEYCPYCATERWAMAVALSRFGTFSGLHGIHSSSTDVYPSTPTLTFYKSTYRSKYLTFTPVETTTEDKNVTLQTPTAQQNQVWQKYDPAGNIPFIDFGNKYLINGVTFNPQVLQGKTWSQVAAALNDKSSPIAQGADGSANVITAAICKLTNDQPGNVCTAQIKSLQSQL
jgi:thiol-disulfide isomerase/thioredoxin